jgi:23S rRNA (cytosine1962-C5)-methyltransferase
MDSATIPALKLKRGEDRRLRAGHLWVFSNEVDTQATPLTAFARGALARVTTDRNHFLGYAYVNPNTLIAARLLSRDESRPPNLAWLRQRLQSALELRTRLYPQPYYRLVYGEADGVPGLVVDRFGDVLVAQSGTVGIDALRGDIETALAEVLGAHTLIWKNDGGARDLEGLAKGVEATGGASVPRELQVREGDAKFVAPLADGQKTGWFYDQALNRERLRRYVPQGARVLDVCSYVGAWAVAARYAGAAEALCVDSSALALEYAERNATLNHHKLQTRRDDAFDALKTLNAEGAKFDVVVLDPPAFVKRKKDLPQGQAAYRKLNQLALPLVTEGGTLVSCSCSYHLAEEDLVAAVQAAARPTSRFVQVLERGGQAPDHPVHPAIPETRYLKALFCRVTRE